MYDFSQYSLNHLKSENINKFDGYCTNKVLVEHFIINETFDVRFKQLLFSKNFKFSKNCSKSFSNWKTIKL